MNVVNPLGMPCAFSGLLEDIHLWFVWHNFVGDNHKIYWQDQWG